VLRTGVSLGWWSSAPIPKGCRFPPVRSFERRGFCLVPHSLLRRPYMLFSMELVLSWAGGILLRNDLFSRSCNILLRLLVVGIGSAFLLRI